MGAVVDQLTGKVTFAPFSMCCADSYFSEPEFEYIKFRRSSGLVVFTGKRNEDGPESRLFYAFDNGRFKPMTSVGVPESQSSTAPVCRESHSDTHRLACYDRQAGH